MRYLWLVLLVLAAIPLAGCDAIEGIFKAGMWVGVFAVILVIAVIGFVVAKMRA